MEFFEKFLGKVENTAAAMDTDRAIEKTENNDTVRTAVEEYKLLQDRISFGGHTSQDTPLVEAAEAKILETLKSAGVTLEFIQMENVDEERDSSLRVFVSEYLGSINGESQEAA